MEVGFYKDVYHEYMVIDKNPEEKEGGFEEQLLHNKAVTGLLSMKLEYVGDCCKYYYDISRLESLENIKLDKRLDYDMIVSVFEGMRQLLKTLEDYLLVAENLWIDASGIYRRRGGREIYFTYVPAYQINFREQLKELLSWLMKSIEHSQKDTVIFVYGFYTQLCENEDVFSILNHMNTIKCREGKEKQDDRVEQPQPYLKKLETSESRASEGDAEACEITFDVGETKPDDADESGERSQGMFILLLLAGVLAVAGFVLNDVMTEILFEVCGVLLKPWIFPAIFLFLSCICIVLGGRQKIKAMIHLHKNQENDEFWQESQRPDYRPLLQRETSVLRAETDRTLETDEDETVLLGKNYSKDILVLKRMGEEKLIKDVIYVTETPFVIGKQYDKVHYQLGDAAVSRRHLEIRKEGRRYEAVDLSSTNGTWLNGIKFESYVTYEIKQGDVLKIANIPFSVSVKER